MALQAPARTQPDTTMPSAPAAADGAVLVRGPDYVELLRRAQAARAATLTALTGHMVAATGAWLERLRERISSPSGTRSFSSQP